MKLDYTYKFYTSFHDDEKWYFFDYYSSRYYGLKKIEECLYRHPCISLVRVMVERYAFGCKDDDYCRYFIIEKD